MTVAAAEMQRKRDIVDYCIVDNSREARKKMEARGRSTSARVQSALHLGRIFAKAFHLILLIVIKMNVLKLWKEKRNTRELW